MGMQENQDINVETTLSEVKIVESAESIENKLSVLVSLGFTNSEMNLETLKNHSFDLDRTINYLLEAGDTMIDESEILINNKLATLTSLGFADGELNAKMLKKNSYDLDRTVVDLLEQDMDAEMDAEMDVVMAGPQPIEEVDPSEREDCLICSDEYESEPANWKVLQCTHKLCTQCYKQIQITRTTMSGVTHTFTKCPFCMISSGVEIGTCPDGTMTISVVPTPCQGYEPYNSISIQYCINNDRYQLSRTAYLPNNDAGNEVLKLLQTAWDRRICFTIGTSATNGQEDVVVWNIHHKTAQNGGVESHGYPDDTYMNRCKMELNAYGIEWCTERFHRLQTITRL